MVELNPWLKQQGKKALNFKKNGKRKRKKG